MNTNPIDLSPLDPTLDKNRLDRTVRALTNKIMRALEQSPATVLARVFVPIMVVAILVLVSATVGTWMLRTRYQRVQPRPTTTFAQWARGKTTLNTWQEVELIRGLK